MTTKGLEKKISFKMVAVADYATPMTGLSVVTEISLDGATFVPTTNTAVEIGYGWYYVILTATEMTADEIVLRGTGDLAAQSDRLIQTDSLQPDITAIMGAGFTSTSHSLAERPVGGAGGGGGHCAWWDSDIDMARKFFHTFPKQFGTFKDTVDVIQTKIDNDSVTKMADALSAQDMETQAKIKIIADAVANLQQSTEVIETLLLRIANVDTLEELYT